MRSLNWILAPVMLLAAVALVRPAVAAEKAEKDIVDTAVAAGDFTTLVAAVKAAGLVEALKSDGPFTVFAPTDAAFAKLPKGTVDSLLKDKEKLGKILKYHVVAGKVMAADAAKLDSADTLAGASLKIQAKDGGVMINDAKVIKADIVTSNGVIHVIDTVLIPE
ncbi:hypothetical protein C5Y93_20640 [Blastopirellula marina]|uniref:FAS1 domain-containing protein n=2 Tax=Blastopirellula marina TaxID=124 RepID=A0A2S8GIV4_9BACT|nr:fasciclin domain-containing protein [Blastopirellula marina]PQO44369.1 hypothetical protein C5Y93_20640 [Blastopirellula marina]